MKNFNFLKRVLWLLIPLLTLFNLSAWATDVDSNTSSFAATSGSLDTYISYAAEKPGEQMLLLYLAAIFDYIGMIVVLPD